MIEQKNPMKIIILFTLFVFMASCSEQHRASENRSEDNHTGHHKDHHGSANEHMYQSPVSDLAKRFESPERDAYQKPEKVLEYLGDVEGKTIVDIGAGSGYFSVKLASKGAKVIAADVNDEFQEIIKKRIEENSLTNIETRKIPYDSPDLKNGEADMVLIVNTYHHIENRTDYFPKVKQGTKTEGKLVIIDFFKVDAPVGPPVNHKIAIDKVIHELKEAGYTSFEINVDLLPYQYIITAK